MQLLRSRVSYRLNALTLQRSVTQAPSETTTVLLKKLHPSATAALLQETIDTSGLRIRKTHIEPGCAVHVTNEVQAECVSTLLKHEFGCSTMVESAMFPALLLKNLPSRLSSQDIKKSFVKHDPKNVHLSGGTTFVCHLTNNLEALAVAKIVQDISLNGQALCANPNKLGENQYSVFISNVPCDISVEEAQKAIDTALSAHSSRIIAVPSPKQGHVLTIRVPAEAIIDSEAVVEKLASLSNDTNPFTVSAAEPVKIPALFLRNISKIGKTNIEGLMSEYDYERIQFTYKSKDVLGDLAVVYFKTQDDALSCLKAIKNKRIEGKRLSSSYRETAQPGILLTGLDLSSKADAEEIMRKYADIDPVHCVMKSRGELVIVFRDIKDAATANVMSLKNTFQGKTLNSQVTDLYDTGFKITMGTTAIAPPSRQAILEALESIKVPVKDVTVESNVNAFVTFETLHRASLALHSVEDGSLDLGSEGGRLTSTISVFPASVVAVENFPEDVPVSQISDFLQQHGIKPLCIDRSAILKFKRHMEVIPGLKVLKTLQLGGLQLQPKRYRQLNRLEKDLEYDTYGNDEVFDSDSLRQTMKDYLHYDPASRLQIARNNFERAVFSAKQEKNTTFLHDHDAHPQIQDEINRLMQADEENLDVDRLFELYIQREDMHRFAHDFRSLTALFGKAEGPEKDPFNWSSFKIDSDEEFLRLREAMRLSAELDSSINIKDWKNRKQYTSDEILQMVDSGQNPMTKAKPSDDDFGDFEESDDNDGGFAPLKGAAEVSTRSNDDGEDEDDIEIRPASTDSMTESRHFQDDFDENNSPENFSEVVDRDGYVWSGLVINTDTTNTTLPSGRLMTHRCLVMVGNMKGAGGFGMGKGENSQLAMKRAFRYFFER